MEYSFCHVIVIAVDVDLQDVEIMRNAVVLQDAGDSRRSCRLHSDAFSMTARSSPSLPPKRKAVTTAHTSVALEGVKDRAEETRRRAKREQGAREAEEEIGGTETE